MVRLAAPLLLFISCLHATSDVDRSSAASRDVEDIPALFPVVNRLVWITWREGERPTPFELSVFSSRAGYEEISFYTSSTAAWLHVMPNFATTPARLSLSIDPAVPDAVGEIVISAPGATWEAVHVRVAAQVVQARPQVGAAVNAASFSTAIAPGAIVTLFGSHLGPGALVQSELVDGAYQTEVANTTFELEGLPCPILYVSEGQSGVIIPYGVEPGMRALEVTTSYDGQTYTGTALLDVAQVAPGIFTLSMTGRGPAAAMNEDYSLNAETNPARRGSYVIFYATGLGELESRPLKDGVPETRGVRHKTTPTASIGTKAAFVYYAGSAPGLVSAVSQVNVLIPADAPSGAVELRLVSGTTASQEGVTVFVH